MERTLCIFKPDLAVDRERVASALAVLLVEKFVPVALIHRRIGTLEAYRLYEEHEGKPFHKPNIAFMTSGPVWLMVLERNDACAFLRKIVGATDPKQAGVGTLRALYGTDLPRNAVHASADVYSAEREIKIFFPEMVW